MKKNLVISFFTIGAIFVALISIIFIISYNTKKNTTVVISEDYSTIEYNEKIYRSYYINNTEKLPEFLDETINATVDNRSFLWDFFLTDYIFISKDGRYIRLVTDYDFNESDYYKIAE